MSQPDFSLRRNRRALFEFSSGGLFHCKMEGVHKNFKVELAVSRFSACQEKLSAFRVQSLRFPAGRVDNFWQAAQEHIPC